MDNDDYQRQYDSVMEEDDIEAEGLRGDNGMSIEASYSNHLADVLGSDEEGEGEGGREEEREANGTVEDEADDEVAQLKNGTHGFGDTSMATEAGSSISSLSLRPLRPWQFPTPRRLRSLRPDPSHLSSSFDSPSQQQQSNSPSILSDDGSSRLGWMLPYGEPVTNGNPADGSPGLVERGGEADPNVLSRSFLRTSRLCALNDQEGSPTVMAVSGGVLAVGTREGKVGLFDRSKGWTGVVTLEGVVTALAISSDKTFLAVGTSLGHIYLYDVAKLSTPARHVNPVAPHSVAQGRSEGHLQGSKILHLAFVGARHTAIVSADEYGLSFYHSLGKILGVSSNDTLRILGKYPEGEEGERTRKLTVLAMATMPLGSIPHPSDSLNFVALLTPSKMVLVGLKPAARTWYRQMTSDRQSETVAGCLAWLPSSKASPTTLQSGLAPPVLAFSFGRHLHFVKLFSSAPGSSQVNVVEEKKLEWTHPAAIEAIQWLSPDFLVVYSDAKMSLFDVRVGRCTEEQAMVRPISNAWISPELLVGAKVILPSTIGSLKAYKGSLFILTPNEIVASSLISWADRILALVSAGNFLGAIELTTTLLQDKGTSGGSRVGLPEAFASQKPILSSRLLELMRASTSYAFSEDRMKDDMIDQRGGIDRTPLFEGLARVCAQASLALQDFTFLFDELFDVYSEAGIEAIFADQMEAFIIGGQMRDLPIAVVQRLIAVRKRQGRYDLAERIIWNVDPVCLDLDQAISLCLEQGLHDALIYVYTRALHDFVGPIVELLPLIKRQDGDAYRIMSYLSVTLIGLDYPNRERLEEGQATLARSSLYSFLFSGHCVIWPPGPGGKVILTQDDNDDDVSEPTFPYLCLLLRFDAEALLDALDVGFEDSWLDEGDMTRQAIVSIFLDLVLSHHHGRIFIAIFVARNAPKFPQFIHLTPAQVQTLLLALCAGVEEEGEEEQGTLEDRQFAVECLLSAYRPPHTADMLDRFESAGFVDILRRIYQSEGKWDKLAKMIVSGPSTPATLDGIEAVLRKSKKDAKVQSIVMHALPTLVDVDVKRCVAMVQRYMTARQTEAVQQLNRSPHRQLAYLSALMDTPSRRRSDGFDKPTRNLYVSLVCSLEPQKLVKCLDERGVDYFDLSHVVEVAEGEDVMDGVLWARDRLNQTDQGLQALDQYIYERQFVLRSGDVNDSTAGEGVEEEVDEAKEQIRVAVEMAVRICTERVEEQLWIRLLKIVIQLTHDSRQFTSLAFSRMLLEDTLSSFVSSTSADRASFSTLFKRLVTDQQGSTYAEVRSISDGMMAANKLREELLTITNRLFDRDVHQELVQLTQRQRIGWRPTSTQSACRGCGQGCIGNKDRSRVGKRTSLSTERQLLPPTRIKSPFLEPPISPRPDKGKGVERNRDENGGDDFFSLQRSALTHATDPVDVFSATPARQADDVAFLSRKEWDWRQRGSWEGGQEEEEEADGSGPDEGLIVCSSGEIWHRRCAPTYMLEMT